MTDPVKKIGKYEVLGLLGRGAMGAVHLAHDPFIDRKVAIKVCTTEQTDMAATVNMARRMFFNEAQSAGALEHPNILHVYDAGETDEGPYIVMEYIAGGRTLSDHCKPDALLPVEQAVRLVQQCANALDYAHQRGVTHRDIKPANLMLTLDGDLKIGDFGIAQRTQTDKTQVLGTFGSPRYMSPEQAQDQTLTPRTDLYSLGVVMYELLTGEPPFDGDGLAGLIYSIVHRQPKPVSDLRPEVSPAVSDVVRRAMEKDPDRRFQTGAEFADALAVLFAKTPEVARELTEEERFDSLRGLDFFRDFSDGDVREVLEICVFENYPSGHVLMQQGNQEHSFYVIVSGDVAVSIDNKPVANLAAGACVGEIGYLNKAKRIATAIARGPIQVIKIDSPATDWASIPCQMRLSKVFQRILIDRLTETSRALAVA